MTVLDGLSMLIERNTRWAARMVDTRPDYFSRLANQQSPAYLWIGCSDSRVPANQIVDLPPGEVFVHRNVANLVYDSDENVQIEQVQQHVRESTAVHNAMERRQELSVHGAIYGLNDGRLRVLG